jgi:Metallo-beta-lactamase superfamily
MAADDRPVRVGERLPVQTRTIAPGIHWLSSCSEIIEPEKVMHMHTCSVFLIVGGDASLLVDVGSAPFVGEVEEAVAELAGPRGLQWIFPTHLEHPHAGGLSRIADRFPSATIVADARDYDLYFPELGDRIRNVEVGDEIDLGGGYHFTFLPAVVKDLVTTLWGYESSQRVMFVSDGCSYTHREAPEDVGLAVHLPEECTAILSELQHAPTVEDAAVINRAAMWWTHHLHAAPFAAEFKELLEQYPADLLAPAHGGVIDDIESFIPIMEASFDMAYAMGPR